MIRAIAIGLGIALLCAACSRPAPPGIEMTDAWLRPAPPGVAASAAYLSVRNNSNKTLQITRISSRQFSRIEMHETKMVDGKMQMRALPMLTIAAGETLSLAPGGMHLMLFEPASAPAGLEFAELAFFDGQQPLAELRVPIARENPYAER